MKKVIILIFAAALVIALAACGGTEDTTDTTPTQGATGQQQAQQPQTDGGAVGQQQQQAGGTQDTGASQGESGQQADPTIGAPEQNRNIELFNEFIAEYARANPARRQGISNGVAFKITDFGIEYLHGISSGQTYTLPTGLDLRFVGNIIYWNGSIFARVVDARGINLHIRYNPRILRFDMQGNLISEFSIQEHHGREAEGATFGIQDGKIVLFTNFGSNDRVTEVLSADDFSVILSPLTVTRDIGHGRTEDVTVFRGLGDTLFAPIILNDTIYVFADDWFAIDLLTGESQEAAYFDRPVIGRIGDFVIGSGNRIANTETGESLEGAVFNDQFTGTNFHRVSGQEVARLNPYTTEFETIFVAPNPVYSLDVLDDEYLIVHDEVGKFLYRVVDGDINGELVREIILP